MNRPLCNPVILAVLSAVLTSSKAAGPMLSGTVTDESGRAVKAASVALESLDGATRVSKTTGPDGSFSFEDIPVGSYSLSASEPDHLFAIYGPVAVVAGKSVTLDVETESLPNDGRDPVTCDQSLVWGQVRGAIKTLPSEMLFCMKGAKGKACTHLNAAGSYALHVPPAKYQLSLQGPLQEDLVSQSVDVTYCGEYRTRISLLD
jgi:Carboxypeptidase regulatory-like domain